ncbi:zinc finger CCCH domain-containing protein 9-like [Zingiber officinale]|uniref:zinc finger CCCH domain-containing protein 9-like n=1 Tax=Zingiber officinale TaxID=94328 RepID=UPI001C4D8891|nr:zinc finger CCCH domain-containing protein 9-like [Zingiber officinale]
MAIQSPGDLSTLSLLIVTCLVICRCCFSVSPVNHPDPSSAFDELMSSYRACLDRVTELDQIILDLNIHLEHLEQLKMMDTTPSISETSRENQTNPQPRGSSSRAQLGESSSRAQPGESSGLIAYPQGSKKTQLCIHFEKKKQCRFGSDCNFAHGPRELHPIIRHPLYRTKPCMQFHSEGFCSFGATGVIFFISTLISLCSFFKVNKSDS